MCAVDAERDRALGPFRGAGDGPHRAIRHREHLAPPDHVELGRRGTPGEAIGDAGAAAARFERQHQARPFGRAPARARPKAELAMKTVDARRTPLDEMESRVPDQRAESEHPDAARPRRSGEDLLHLRGALLGRHEAHVRTQNRPHRSVQRAVQNAFARQLQAAHAGILTCDTFTLASGARYSA